MRPRIAILGTNEPERPARASIGAAIADASAHLQVEAEVTWIGDPECSEVQIDNYNGFFIAPGGPNEPYQNILSLIRQTRAKGIPCLGTCGGFQRMVEEYARTELGLDAPQHAELNPHAKDPLFTHLPCSLVQKEETVFIGKGRLASQCYKTDMTTESFFCSFGINPRFIERLKEVGLCFSGHDREGSPRIIELADHPFFMGTLFVPQVRSSAARPHPSILAFVYAASQNGKTR